MRKAQRCYIPPVEEALDDGGVSVGAYLTRLRVGALALLTLRALVLGLAAGALVFALASSGAGAVASRVGASVAWLLILTAAGLGARRGAAPGRGLSGSGIARLLESSSPDLSSAARSAYELEARREDAASSSELVVAHRRGVAEALARLPLRRALPWRWLTHREVLVAALSMLGCLMLLRTSDRAAAGSFALTHPDFDADDTRATADIVSRVEAEITPPAYLRLEPRTLVDPAVVEARVGSNILYAIRTRVAGSEAVLTVGEREVRLESRSADTFVGRFVARNSAPLSIRVRDPEGVWLEDAGRRSLRVAVDQAPRVEIISGADTEIFEREAPARFGFEASDDAGLSALDLVVRLPEGTERRIPIQRFGLEETTRLHRGEARFTPAELGARPGDVLVAFLEATDGDSISGPNVGRSVEVSVTLASDTTRRASLLEDLSELVDRSVDTLADRLESPPPPSAEDAKPRLRALLRSTEALTSALDAYAAGSRANPNARAADAPLFLEMARSLRRLQSRERDLVEPPVASRRRRLTADAKMVDALEDGTLLLADLLARSRIEDAAALARELEELRREMTSLVSELRRTGDPDAQRALMGALARARRRMNDLLARISAMGTEVPSEFVNAGALSDGPADDALRSLREALERGDLDAADRHLIELRRQLDGLAGMLGDAETGFAESHFGPRDRAFAEAMDALAGLEAEQRRLAEKSEELRRTAARRAIDALESGGEESERALEDSARVAADALRQIPRRGIGEMESEILARIRQRVADASDALSTGDLGEARAMAAEASLDLDALTRDLELSSLMFPGRRGELAEAARAAGAAGERLRDLRTEIDRQLPDLERHLTEPERRSLRADADQQARVSEAAEGIAARFSASPDGSPLSGEAAEVIGGARESMEAAEGALRQLDSVGASRAQDEAARRLTELREELEEERSPSGGGSGSSGEDRSTPQERVEIPAPGSGHAPIELRRRLLDARRADVPEAYLEAAERYYEELLR